MLFETNLKVLFNSYNEVRASLCSPELLVTSQVQMIPVLVKAVHERMWSCDQCVLLRVQC